MTINISSFGTQNLADIRMMFCRCSSLTNVYLFIFKKSSDTKVNNMFDDCNSLIKKNIFKKKYQLIIFYIIYFLIIY